MARSFDMLVPVRRARWSGGRAKLPRQVRLASASKADELGLGKTADALADAGLAVAWSVGDDRQATIRVVRDAKITEPEGYRLSIAPAGVLVTASADAGAFYGLATLRELVRIHGATLPCGVIDDAPAFARRGVYHDLARGKIPRLKTLKGLVDRLAEWKINELQLYIENAFAFSKHPLVSEGYSPMSAEETLELQSYCKARHIRLVPSLASFGHLEKVLRRPEYAHLNEVPNGSTLCPTDPASLRFVEDLYSEYVPLFEADDFNVCCDETWDLGRGRSRSLCQRVGAGRVYLDFLLKIRKLCQKFGKRMNAWSDIILDHPELLGDVPRDIVMLNWEYEAQGKRIKRTREIATPGLPLMVCPGTSAWNTIGSRWTNASENIRNFAAEGARHGAEGVLNTDWGDGGHRQFLAVSLMGFAFGAAESWKPGAADIASFPRTFAFHTFGERTGTVGAAIEALGTTYLKHGFLRANADPMYFNLNEPLRPDGYYHGRMLDRFPPEGLAAMLASLPEGDIWTAPQADEFNRLTMAEYALSGRLIALYSLRSAVAWDLGMGAKVTSKTLNGLADGLLRTQEDFHALWLARNKPSRLTDVLTMFKNAAKEARKLAKK